MWQRWTDNLNVVFIETFNDRNWLVQQRDFIGNSAAGSRPIGLIRTLQVPKCKTNASASNKRQIDRQHRTPPALVKSRLHHFGNVAGVV